MTSGDNQNSQTPAIVEVGFSAPSLRTVEISCAKDLGRAIHTQRKRLGYGLVDAAALCQVGTRFLFELEHGKGSVEFDRAIKVAKRFGLRLKMSGVDDSA